MQPGEIEKIVETINRELPVHGMWDGFWIRSFKRGTLIISCSQDRIYRRDFDLVFKQVNFFNLPERWPDTAVNGDILFRLESPETFQIQHPEIDLKDHFVFAFNLGLSVSGRHSVFTFHVSAKHVYLNRCEPGDNFPESFYEDPYSGEAPPWMGNRR